MFPIKIKFNTFIHVFGRCYEKVQVSTSYVHCPLAPDCYQKFEAERVTNFSFEIVNLMSWFSNCTMKNACLQCNYTFGYSNCLKVNLQFLKCMIRQLDNLLDTPILVPSYCVETEKANDEFHRCLCLWKYTSLFDVVEKEAS